MDWATVMNEAFSDVFSRLFGFVPGLLSVLAILVVGWILARVLKRITLSLLRAGKLDDLLENVGVKKVIRDTGSNLPPSEILGRFVYWVVMIAVFIGITNYLQLPTVSSALNNLLLYVPNILAALIIIVLAFILANALAATIRGAAAKAEIASSDLLAEIAKWSLIVVGAIIALDQLGVETSILKLALTYFVGASAVALALAFGLGSASIAKEVVAYFFIRDKFKIGQKIRVADYSGEIKEISLAFTAVATDKGIAHIPNSLLLEKVSLS